MMVLGVCAGSMAGRAGMRVLYLSSIWVEKKEAAEVNEGGGRSDGRRAGPHGSDEPGVQIRVLVSNLHSQVPIPDGIVCI